MSSYIMLKENYNVVYNQNKTRKLHVFIQLYKIFFTIKAFFFLYSLSTIPAELHSLNLKSNLHILPIKSVACSTFVYMSVAYTVFRTLV